MRACGGVLQLPEAGTWPPAPSSTRISRIQRLGCLLLSFAYCVFSDDLAIIDIGCTPRRNSVAASDSRRPTPSARCAPAPPHRARRARARVPGRWLGASVRTFISGSAQHRLVTTRRLDFRKLLDRLISPRLPLPLDERLVPEASVYQFSRAEIQATSIAEGSSAH
eukprot:2448074-Pleurochrysis_carterae.AAC.2